METIWPKSLRRVALATHILMRGNLPWVHDRMREWAEARYSRRIAKDRRETCLHEAFEKVLSDPRLQDEKAGPPKKGWGWRMFRDPLPELGKPMLVTGWISPAAVRAVVFPEWSDPLLKGRPSDLPYKVVRLAALCTAYFDTEDPIRPSEWLGIGADKRDWSAEISYDLLVVSSRKLTDQYADKLEAYRLTVEAAINKAGVTKTEGDNAQQGQAEEDGQGGLGKDGKKKTKGKPRRRKGSGKGGRQPLSQSEIDQRCELWEEWTDREGISSPNFLDDYNQEHETDYTVTYLRNAGRTYRRERNGI